MQLKPFLALKLPFRLIRELFSGPKCSHQFSAQKYLAWKSIFSRANITPPRLGYQVQQSRHNDIILWLHILLNSVCLALPKATWSDLIRLEKHFGNSIAEYIKLVNNLLELNLDLLGKKPKCLPTLSSEVNLFAQAVRHFNLIHFMGIYFEHSNLLLLLY